MRIDPSTGAAFDIQYDGRGNITDDGPNSYVYDAINRLTSSPSQSVTLSYDAADRLSKITGTGSRQFLYDGANLIAEYDDSGVVLRRYVHGPGTDNPIACYDGGTGAAQKCLPGVDGSAGLYTLTDERGSVLAYANDNQSSWR